uniref:Ferrous iron transport protein B n=1 Tax=candidate division WOR-3 bacterium TaxID=2052148 RepID=A0A7V3ZXJ5_UNCW3
MRNTIRIALVGQPNCGKSTFFNQLVGYKAQTSNFPGTTVEFLTAEVTYEGTKLIITDLPGIYSLLGEEPAERVTLKYLLENPVDLIINILDSSVISRSLELTIELSTLGIPMILVLNMMDEAEKKGIKVDTKKLEEILGIPVIQTVATQGKGVDQVIKRVFNPQKPLKLLKIDLGYEAEEAIKTAVAQIKKLYPSLNEEACKILAIADIDGQLGILAKEEAERIKNSLSSLMKIDSPWLLIHQEKHKLAMEIFESCAKITHVKKQKFLDYKLDSILMNSYAGPLIAFLTLLGIFFLVQKLGGLLSEIFALPFDRLSEIIELTTWNEFLKAIVKSVVDGINSGIGIVFPYFIPFVFLLSLLEDLGYLSRLAFVLDHFLHRIGLHGKSVVPFILGYGCNVPAVFSTRIIESERERVTTAFLIPFIPCSARLAIIFALANLFIGFRFTFALFVLNIFVIAILAKIASLLYKSEATDFILEIPPYRIPTMKGILSKVWYKLKDFIFFAWPVIVIGSLVLSLMQFFGLDDIINRAFSPLVQGVLGINQKLGIVLIFGILRKELALIMASEALKTPIEMLNTVMTKKEMVVFVTFVTFYTPCLSTILALWKEIGLTKTLIQIAMSLILASLLGILMGMFF